MAITTAAILEKIEGLSASIGKESATSNKELAVFQLNNKKVTFTFSRNDQIEVLVEQNDKKIVIPRENIEGIPKGCFVDFHKMKAFLSQCYLKVSEYSDSQGFKLSVNLKLNGGGNIDVGIQTWPLINGKFVIPYHCTGSSDSVDTYEAQEKERLKIQLTRIEQKLLANIKNGNRPDLEQELNAANSIFEAIALWNKTGLVELLTTEEYKEKCSVKMERWIKFDTSNVEGICEAPCIGMCPPLGEHVVTCDIEGKFHLNPIQSILHEIGHVIGLRHEHARSDRDCYVDTNFPPEGQTCLPIGPYNFDSVMHYEIGQYDEGYLLLKENDNLFTPKPIKTVQDHEIGKRPIISEGDQEAVRELIKLAKIKEIKEKSIKPVQKEFSHVSLTSSSPFLSKTSLNSPSSSFLKFSPTTNNSSDSLSKFFKSDSDDLQGKHRGRRNTRGRGEFES